MGAFTLIDSPSALPGCCFICQSGSRKQYIDLGFSLDYYGAVYICVDECLREMATQAGFLSIEDAAKLREENERLGRQFFQANKRAVDLEDTLHGVLLSSFVIDNSKFDVSARQGNSEIHAESGQSMERRTKTVSKPNREAVKSDTGIA